MGAAIAYAIQRAVRAERARLGLSQQQLADRLGDGWTRSRVASIETGERRVNLDEAPDLCRALGAPLAVLLLQAPEDDKRALGI